MEEFKGRFIWFRDVPAWMAALGTSLLALIAFFTIGPVIENLHLRERNLTLTQKNEELADIIQATEMTKDRLSKEVELLNEQIIVKGDQILHAEERQDILLSSLTQLSGNISEQVQRERNLTSRNDQLIAEIDKLKVRRFEVEQVLKQYEFDITRIERELKETWKANRHFILEQIDTRITA